jgi:hypothetical protein
MGSASCYGDPIWHVQAAIGRALRDQGDPTQPLPDHLAALAREIECSNGVVDEQASLRMIPEAGTSEPEQAPESPGPNKPGKCRHAQSELNRCGLGRRQRQ